MVEWNSMAVNAMSFLRWCLSKLVAIRYSSGPKIKGFLLKLTIFTIYAWFLNFWYISPCWLHQIRDAYSLSGYSSFGAKNQCQKVVIAVQSAKKKFMTQNPMFSGLPTSNPRYHAQRLPIPLGPPKFNSGNGWTPHLKTRGRWKFQLALASSCDPKQL